MVLSILEKPLGPNSVALLDSSIFSLNALMFIFATSRSIDLYFPGKGVNLDPWLIGLVQTFGVVNLLVAGLICNNHTHRNFVKALTILHWIMVFGLGFFTFGPSPLLKIAGCSTSTSVGWMIIHTLFAHYFWEKLDSLPVATSDMGFNVKFVNYFVTVIYSVNGVNLVTNLPVDVTQYYYRELGPNADQVRACWVALGLLLLGASGLVCTAAPSPKTCRSLSTSFLVGGAVFALHNYYPNPTFNSVTLIEKVTGYSWIMNMWVVVNWTLAAFYYDPTMFY
jgi:hypothetical protein